MGIFDRLSMDPGVRDAAAREAELRNTLKAVMSLGNPAEAAADELQRRGIDAKSLQKIVAELSDLTDAQKEQIVALANRADFREEFPPVIVKAQYEPIEEMPEGADLEQLLEPLPAQEMGRALEQFGNDLNASDGRMPILVRGHLGVESRRQGPPGLRLSSENRDVLKYVAKPETTDWGESRLWLDRLVPGYRKLFQRYGKRVLEQLSYMPAYLFAHRRSIFQPFTREETQRGNGSDYEQVMSAMKAKGEPRYLKVAVKDLYVPKQYEQTCAQAPVVLWKEHTEAAPSLVREVSPAMEALTCVEVRVQDNTAIVDTRASYLSILIILGPTNAIHRRMAQGRKPAYQTYLQALRTNPGFFLEALRKHAPEVFEVGNGRKYFGEEGQPWEPDVMTMHMDVPELQAVGEPEERTFRKME